MINIAVIGCGRIGVKRAMAMKGLASITFCFDQDLDTSTAFAKEFGCSSVTNPQEILENKLIDAVLIATRHDSLMTLALASLKSGKHVFVEKPGGINAPQLKQIQEVVSGGNRLLHVGYNHKFHPGIKQALEIVNSGSIGEILFLRARYGHGGRVGYNKEWRANKEISGGGELIDQGTHLLDLSLAFLGDITLDYAATPNYFWDMPVEDNAFIAVKNKNGSIGFLHASCTEWKNTFSLEIYCKKGKLEVSGLGGSYGIEKLIFYKMLPEMGPPETVVWEFPEPDESWRLEIIEFLDDIKHGTVNSENVDSSYKVLELVDEIYRRSGR